jgi:exonuclease SbcD
MNLLHTSDWHLGRTLYGHKRYAEFASFLNWLIATIHERSIDVVLIAGDVFDTSLPSNKAQELYYQFLCTVAHSRCRHIVVIAGNHDSPSFLDAPKDILRALNVYVVGAMAANPADEVLVLKDQDNMPEAIICAVPYLRDKDLRTAEVGESVDDKNTKLIQGLKNHYAAVCAVAQEIQQSLAQKNVPIIGMGHLFAAGGQTTEGDGVRELYVGSLAHVTASLFPSCIDYLALGHLHIPQKVGKKDHFRYSGSPIPMGFGEAKQQKKLILVSFNEGKRSIEEILIPCFQPLARLTGTLDEIQTAIHVLKEQESTAWLEIEYTGLELVANLRDLIEQHLEGSLMEIRRIKNKRVMDKVINQIHRDETLDDLNEHDVFARCLEANKIPVDERVQLTSLYNELILSMQEEDVYAE